MTVAIDLSSNEGLHKTLEGILSRQDNTDTALAKLAGPGLTAEAALEGSGVAAFRAKDGKLRLTAAQRRDTVTHDGETYIVESVVPGLFDKGATAHLSADEAATVTAYRETLGEVNACRALGVRALPADHLGRLMHIADGAPLTLRAELTAHSRSVAGAASAQVRRHGSLASSSANGSGSPGYSWVADEYMPDALDVTDGSIGLYDVLIRGAGGPGLHQTAKTKIRVLTATGGMRIFGRQTTDTIGVFPKTNVTTDVAELVGRRAVHSSLIDGASLRDPREALDWLALHRQAGQKALIATADYLLFHGDDQTAPASHAYAVAGLQALNLDHRDMVNAGDATDPMLLASGLRALSSARTTTLDLASHTGAAANAVFSTQANAIKAHTGLRALIGSQYKRGSIIIVTQETADLFAAISVGVNGRPFFTPMTSPTNPWLVGELYDGTLVMSHFGITNLFNTSGVVASGGSYGAILGVNPSAIMDVQGPDHGRFTATDAPDGDARLVTIVFQRKPWCPLPTAKKPFAFGYNFK
jgi:hypothetical protein